MADAAQDRVQSAVQAVIESLDFSHLRALQLRMHQCALKCVEDEDKGIAERRACVDQCSKETDKAHAYDDDLIAIKDT